MHIVLFILVLFVLVLVHEWGHFIVAKKTGMRVDEFGIGFPPRLFGIKKGETLYSINAIPLGGFVKILGEDGDVPLSDTEKPRAFSNRPLWAQALVLLAGVTVNVLFAWVLISLAFMMGTKNTVDEAAAGPEAKLTVISVLKNSPAAKAGVVTGDVISKVVNTNGHPVEVLHPSTVSDFIHDAGTVTITYTHGGKEKVTEVSTHDGLVPGDPSKRVVGINMGLVEETHRPFFAAIYEAGGYTLTSIVSIAVGISHLAYDALRFKADFSGVAGPVGIAGMVGDAASMGAATLLIFMALISLNLAVINVLPFPALDGGRLLLVIIEWMKGSALSPRISQGLNAFGFILLLVLMVAVTYNDILKIIH